MAEWKLQEATVNYEGSDYIPPIVQAGFDERTQMVVELISLVRQPGVAVCDLGCNAGHLLEKLDPPCWGYDIADSPLSFGREFKNDVRKADITKDDLELAPIVTICEVLEHLEDPHSMINRLRVEPVEFVIASGPYKEEPNDHYEQHLWAWDEEGFAQLFRNAGFQVVRQAIVGIFQALVAIP